MKNVAVFSNLTEGQQVRLTRLAKGLRQIDLAALAKVSLTDICMLEKDRYLRKSRKIPILEALGLLDDENEN
jgi:hypothetical protein